VSILNYSVDMANVGRNGQRMRFWFA